jgi:hypothetical protein
MSFEKDFKSVKNGFTAIGVVVVLVALVLTIVSVVVALTVSPWFFIATVILGGYTLVGGLGVFVQRKMLNASNF